MSSPLTRVDVSNVTVGVTQEGLPIFRAAQISFRVDGRNGLWFIMKDATGQPFAVAQVDETRAAAMLTQIMLDMGGEIREGRTANVQ